MVSDFISELERDNSRKQNNSKSIFLPFILLHFGLSNCTIKSPLNNILLKLVKPNRLELNLYFYRKNRDDMIRIYTNQYHLTLAETVITCHLITSHRNDPH